MVGEEFLQDWQGELHQQRVSNKTQKSYAEREAYLGYGSLLIVLPDLILRALGSSVYFRFLRRVAIFCPLCASLHQCCFGGKSSG